jgi:DNA repair exonuclease SbcCD ATPase subunit
MGVDETQLKKEEEDLKTLTKNLKLLEKKIKEEKELVKILSFWKESFSDRGIKSMLIDGAIPHLNKYVRNELEKVAPGKFIVSFSTLSTTKGGDIRDKFSVSVLNTENGADSHKMLSGGEKRLVDVATMRALRILSEEMYQKKINLLLLDEVLDSLDTENSEIFCNVLKKLSTDTAICLISHNKQLSVDIDHSYAL